MKQKKKLNSIDLFANDQLEILPFLQLEVGFLDQNYCLWEFMTYFQCLNIGATGILLQKLRFL